MQKLLLFPVLLASCSHDLSAAFSAAIQNEEAMERFRLADIEGANATWREVLEAHPRDPNALVGAAITDLLLLPSAPPVVAAFEERCHQPRLQLVDQLFGPTGIIAQNQLAGRGTSEARIFYFSSPGAGASEPRFVPKAIVSEVIPASSSRPRTLMIRANERDLDDAHWINVTVNADDLVRGDDAITPLVDGVEVDLDVLDGSVNVYAAADLGSYTSERPSGKLRFVKAGTAPGAAVEIELLDVRVSAPPPESCTSSCPPAHYLVSGRIRDVISEPAEFDPSQVPFGEIEAQPGPPRRAEEVVAIEMCELLDDRFIADNVLALTDLIEIDAARLGAALDSPDREALDFVLPAELFSGADDIEVSATDVRALRGLLLTGIGLAEIVAEYRWLAGDLQALAENHDWYYYPDERVHSRVLWPATLAAHLEIGFLTQPEGFDLSRARDRLRAGLRELKAAMDAPGGEPGLLDFQERTSARLMRDLAGTIGAFADSIDSAAPVPLPGAPHYEVHFKAYFDDPLDADQLRQLGGLLRLWSERPGVPGSDVVSERNPELQFELDVLDVRRWSDGLMSYPVVESAIACSAAVACPGGYSCRDDRCELQPPAFARDDAWSASFEREWPRFVSSKLRDAIAF